MHVATESALFFESNGANLFAVLHEADSGIRKSADIALVMCSPFGEEAHVCRRVFVNFARCAAKLGIPVLRFDYFGCGDSDGEFADASIERWIGDIKSAVSFVRSGSNVERVGLVGLRFGASLALLAAENDPTISSLVLWEPIVSLRSCMRNVLRASLAAQMVRHGKVVRSRALLENDLASGIPVDAGGFQLSPALYLGAKQIDLLSRARNFSGDSLVVTIRSTHHKGEPDLFSLRRGLSFSGGNAKLCSVQEPPFWKELGTYISAAEKLNTITLNWILNR